MILFRRLTPPFLNTPSWCIHVSMKMHMQKVVSAEYESTLSFCSAMGLGRWQPIVGLDAKLSYWNSRHCSLPDELATAQFCQPVCAFSSRRFSVVNIKGIWLYFRWHDDTYSKFAHLFPDGGCHCASKKDRNSHFTQFGQPVGIFLSYRYPAVNIEKSWLSFSLAQWHILKVSHLSPGAGCHCASGNNKHSPPKI